MEYYRSSLGQSSHPAALAARGCQGTGYQVGSEGQTGSLLPARSEWGSRQVIASTTVANNNSHQRTSAALGFEEGGGWNSSEPVRQQESGGSMEGGRVVVAPHPPPLPPPPPPSMLPMYPERVGVQDCPFYLRTGTCGFGPQCKFNHPPNGRPSAAGYQSAASSTKGGKIEYPERPGQVECQFYMKTGTCKFGGTCKYHHPRVKSTSSSSTTPAAYQTPRPPLNSLGYPLRPAEKECPYYMRNRVCKFGPTCRFHHPQLPPTNSAGLVQTARVGVPSIQPPLHVNPSPPHLQYPVGPVQPWQVRSLPTARYPLFPHQQVQYVSPPAPGAGGGAAAAGVAAPTSSSTPHVFSQHHHQQAPRAQQHVPSSGNPSQQPGPPYFYTAPSGPVSTAGQLSGEANASGGSGGAMAATAVPPYFPGPGTHFMSSVPMGGPMGLPTQAGGAPGATAGQGGAGGMMFLQQIRGNFPERPGQQECSFYMRTGDCKYGMSCRFHHPKDRGVPTAQCALSSMGLPLRPGQPQCSFYTRFGVCKFGHTCKFDHPEGSLEYSPSASSLVDLPVAPVSFPGGINGVVGATSSGDGRNGSGGEVTSSHERQRQQQQQIGGGEKGENHEEKSVPPQGEDVVAGGKQTAATGGSAMADGAEASAAQGNTTAVAAAASGVGALGGNGGPHQGSSGGMYSSMASQTAGGNDSGSSTG